MNHGEIVNGPLTPEAIKDLLHQKGLKQKDLCPILKLTPQNLSHMMTGARKISHAEEKLLRLYFFGEIPFESIRNENEFTLKSSLIFTEDEWDIISTLANRAGKTTSQWIVGQIREYLAYRDIQQQPLFRVAEDPPAYPIQGNGSG